MDRYAHPRTSRTIRCCARLMSRGASGDTQRPMRTGRSVVLPSMIRLPCSLLQSRVRAGAHPLVAGTTGSDDRKDRARGESVAALSTLVLLRLPRGLSGIAEGAAAVGVVARSGGRLPEANR